MSRRGRPTTPATDGIVERGQELGDVVALPPVSDAASGMPCLTAM
ncbi:hypothetical protein ACIBBD_30965 [Streptomyces sp. NPDC051315]